MDSSDVSLKDCFLISNFIVICCLHLPYEIKKASKTMLLVLQKFYKVTIKKKTICFVSQVLLEDQKGRMLVWLFKKDKSRWKIKRNRRIKQENSDFPNEAACTLTALHCWGYGAVLALSHQRAVFCSLHWWTAVCHAAVFSMEFPEESYSTHRFLLKQTQSSITSCEFWDTPTNLVLNEWKRSVMQMVGVTLQTVVLCGRPLVSEHRALTEGLNKPALRWMGSELPLFP